MSSGAAIAYTQLKPITANIGRAELANATLWQRQVAIDRQKTREAQARNIIATKRIIDLAKFTDASKMAGRFTEEMGKYHAYATTRLTQLAPVMQYMESNNMVATPEYQKLRGEWERIHSIPDMLQNTFNIFNNQIKDLKSKIGKPGGYSEVQMLPKLHELMEIVNGNNWGIIPEKNMFWVKGSDGKKKELSLGEFQSMGYLGKLPAYVDLDKIQNNYITQLSSSKSSYIDLNNVRHIISQKLVSSDTPEGRKERQRIREALFGEIWDDENVRNEIIARGGGKQDKGAVYTFVDDLLDKAGWRKDITTTELVTHDKKDPLTFNDWMATRSEFTKESGGFVFMWDKDHATTTSLSNTLMLKIPSSFNIDPKKVILLDGYRGSTVMAGNSATKLYPGVLQKVGANFSFKPESISTINHVYSGDEEYRFVIHDPGHNFTTDEIVIKNGSVVPDEFFNSAYSIGKPKTGEDTPWIEQKDGTIKGMTTGCASMKAFIGTATFHTRKNNINVKIAVPVIDDNAYAVSTINNQFKTTVPEKYTSKDANLSVLDYYDNKLSGKNYDNTGFAYNGQGLLPEDQVVPVLTDALNSDKWSESVGNIEFPFNTGKKVINVSMKVLLEKHGEKETRKILRDMLDDLNKK